MAPYSIDNRKIESFGKENRLFKRKEFLEVYGQKRAHFFRHAVIYLKKNDLNARRLGITVSRKVGCSVLRNRVKRMFREAFRKSMNSIPDNYDIVVNAKKEAVKIKLEEATEMFLSLKKRIEQ